MLDDIDHLLDDAIALHEAKRFFSASAKYLKILKQDALHADANHNFGLLKVELGLKEEALIFLQTAINTSPNILQYWLTFINTLTNIERFDDARSVLAQADLFGHKDETLNHLRHNLDLAQRNYETLINPDQLNVPKSVNAETNSRGSVKVERKTFISSQENSCTQYSDTRQTKTLDTMQLDQALRLAEKKTNAGLSEDATKIYQDILVKFPKNKRALNGIKKLTKKVLSYKSDTKEPPGDQLKSLVNLYTHGQYQQALTHAWELLKEFPNSVNLYNIIGASNKGLGKLEEAIDAYTKALSIKPDFADALNNMGLVIQQQGKLEKAIVVYTKALSIKPDYADAYYNMGNTLKDQGKLEEAIKALNKALSIKPDFAEALNNMGNCLKEQDKLEEAVQTYAKALSVKPNYAEVYYNLGNVLKEQGKLEDAIVAYTKALSIKPDYAEVILNASSLTSQISDTTLIDEEFEKLLESHSFELSGMPKYQIQQAIRAFLLNDQKLARKHLSSYGSCNPALIAKLNAKDQLFCSAYSSFIQKLIENPLLNEPAFVDHQTLFHLGESHCLSYAHKKIKIQGIPHTVKPRITFGGKAYHFSTEKDNAYKAISKSNFDSLPEVSKVFVSFGEIDCRQDEGFIPAALKLNRAIEDLVSDTIRGYVGWFAEQNQSKNHSLFFLNVPAPKYNEKYTTEVNEEVSSTIQLFNSLLHKTVSDYGFNLIDVYKFTVGRGRFSNGLFHIDNRHISSDAIPEIEKQVTTIL